MLCCSLFWFLDKNEYASWLTGTNRGAIPSPWSALRRAISSVPCGRRTCELRAEWCDGAVLLAMWSVKLQMIAGQLIAKASSTCMALKGDRAKGR